MSATRPMDPDSVIDQLLSGLVPEPSPGASALRVTEPEARLLEAVVAWCSDSDVAATIETADALPDALIGELADLGALRITVPREYGGLGFSDTCLLAVLSALAAEHATLCEIVAAHQVIGAVRPLVRFGTPEQRSRHLPRCTRTVTAFALNEPELGYQTENLQTTARFDPASDRYALTGEKCWITNATVASQIVVLAEAQPSPDAPGGVTAFLVEAGDPGVHVTSRSRFAGLHGLPNGTVRLIDAHLPASRRLGSEGQGLEIALACLEECRTALPVSCLTTIGWCLQQARAWAAEARQRQRNLPTNPQIERHLARLATLGHLGHAVTWHAMRDACAPMDRDAAKVVLSEAAGEATDILMQLYGGRGYETAASAAQRGAQPFAVERVWRDTRVSRIFDGSTELLKDAMAQPMASPARAPARREPEIVDPDTRFLRQSVAELHRLLEVAADRPGAERIPAEGVECVMAMFVLHATLAYREHTNDATGACALAAEQVIADARNAIAQALGRMRSPGHVQRTTELARRLVDGETTTAAARPAVPFVPPGAPR